MKPPLKDLRNAIADTIASEEKAYHLEEMCQYFGLQEEVSNKPWGSASKSGYVYFLISSYSESALVGLAAKIQEYYQSDSLKIMLNKFTGGVSGEIKNIIFAANGPKPDIILSDAMHNTIDIVANAEYCLVYDKPILSKGLSWGDLIIWWQEKDPQSTHQIGQTLYSRLEASLGSIAERFFFSAYYRLFDRELGEKLPALIPQVYFYYDPKTLQELQRLRELYGQERPSLPVQRMDFLILFSDKDRVILEIDGKQHYSYEEEIMIKTNGKYHLAKKAIASPKNYATLASEDRKLRLRGYEIYRFGGYEICASNEKGQLVVKDTAEKDLKEFFLSLFDKYGVTLK